MPRRIRRFIRKLYYDEIGGAHTSTLGADSYDQRLLGDSTVRRKLRNLKYALTRWWVFASVLLVTLLNIYYYNALMAGRLSAESAMSKINVQLQRRRDLSINLGNAIAIYAAHEAKIFGDVSNVRAALVGNVEALQKAPLATSGGQIKALLSKVFAIAEQYPNLKLQSEFNHMLDAIVAIEKDISIARNTYNKRVNVYTSIVMRFPGNFYANMYGFKILPLYIADKDSLEFKPMDFGSQN